MKGDVFLENSENVFLNFFPKASTLFLFIDISEAMETWWAMFHVSFSNTMKCDYLTWQANIMGQDICCLICNLVEGFFFAGFDRILDQAGIFNIDIGEDYQNSVLVVNLCFVM